MPPTSASDVRRPIVPLRGMLNAARTGLIVPRITRIHSHAAGAGWPVSKGADSRIGIVNKQCAERVLLVVHAGDVVDEPGTLDLPGVRVLGGFGGVDLRVDREPADAERSLAQRCAFVDQSVVEFRRPPESGEALAEHAVPATAGRERAAYGDAPRSEPLADRADALADQSALSLDERRPRRRSAVRPSGRSGNAAVSASPYPDQWSASGGQISSTSSRTVAM